MRFSIVTLLICAAAALFTACDDTTDLTPAPHDAGADAGAKDGAADATE